METQAEWEKAMDKALLPMIDGVMNTLYRNSKMDGALDVGYIKHCTDIIQKKVSAYIDSKSDALIGYGLNTEVIL